MTTKRQSIFSLRSSLDSQTETGSEVDWNPQTLAKPHLNPFTYFCIPLSISAPSSAFLSIYHRFMTTALQTYHAATTRVPTLGTLTAKVTHRRKTVVVSIATISALILLAIVAEVATKAPKPRTWEYNDRIDAVFGSGPTFRPSYYERRNPDDLVLEPQQELGVLVAFMAAVTYNVLPPYIDPSKPLDPQLVVGFDTRADGAEEELKALVEETWSNYPVVIFSQLFSPIGRDMKALISTYNIAPKPVIWELDAREDAAVVIPLVHRLTNSSQLPVLLIGGKPVGFPSLTQNVVNPPGIIDQSMSAKSVFEHIRELHDNGELEKLIQSAGGIIGGGKKKKGKH